MTFRGSWEIKNERKFHKLLLQIFIAFQKAKIIIRKKSMIIFNKQK